MLGDDRRRYCGECKLNVYNLSGMTRAEAENLIQTTEGRLCVRFYKRDDGSVITEDCPVGWSRVKQRTKAYVTALASLIFTFFGALGLLGLFDRSREISMGAIPVSSPTPKQTPRVLMGDVSMGTPVPTPKQTPQAMMGNVAMPTPEKRPVMGKVRIQEQISND